MPNIVTSIFDRTQKKNRLTLATVVVEEKSYVQQTKKYLVKYWRPEIVNVAITFSNVFSRDWQLGCLANILCLLKSL